jgi:ATP-binding cassette subfamily F protein uup
MIITLENYTKSYGEKTLFSGVNLSMDPGDKIGIVGVNGTGKSTFLKAVAGLIPVDDGTVVTMRGCASSIWPRTRSSSRRTRC